MKKRKAIVLLSGGLDSATCLYHALRRGYDVACLAFDYGQRHRREISCSRRIARLNGLKLSVVKTAFPWNRSSLVSGGPAVADAVGGISRIPSTYVPGRNTVFLAAALSFAESTGAERIFIGANAVDFSGYPDCRPAYYAAWNRLLASLGTKIKIETPLLRLKKSGIIKMGVRMGVPYELTWSCYRGLSRPCGKCDSCAIRSRGFAEAGFKDPAVGSRERQSKKNAKK
ncbi:MAG: 7-cyano-7-deazaguanine synthase QueC [Elusimicrobia bacterium HGW-Elusimicrobia-1]|nr:MAG: 7-cyano-7-deazaguanine synthase QueC [Elusimicrobia bacterium HGW-Elusimicrobia-1]